MSYDLYERYRFRSTKPVDFSGLKVDNIVVGVLSNSRLEVAVTHNRTVSAKIIRKFIDERARFSGGKRYQPETFTKIEGSPSKKTTRFFYEFTNTRIMLRWSKRFNYRFFNFRNKFNKTTAILKTRSQEVSISIALSDALAFIGESSVDDA